MAENYFSWLFSTAREMDSSLVVVLLVVFGAVIYAIAITVSAQVRINRKVKIIKILKERGPLLYQNSTDKPRVIAITTDLDFFNDITSLKFGVERGDSRPWEPIRVSPVRTFTFAASDAERRPAHSGTVSDLRNNFRWFVEREILGVSLAEYTERELDEILGVLVANDSRLVVPFALSNTRDGEEQWKRHGHQSLQGFKNAMLESLKK